jgi:PPK2 family polyphosphate:nucleotide phosphotransferase
MSFETLRIKPGSKVDLADYGPADKTGVPASKEERARRSAELVEQVDALQDVLFAQRKHKLLIVLQGMDTAGKDGTIRHVFSRVDPLGVRAISFRAPTEEERAHGYLWRIHRQVPALGEIVIFNRSHYEDVLVPRVHGSIDAAECKRRYAQIADFERMLAENSCTIVKFFLHLSKQEQRARLQARIDEPKKHWKFNPLDLEERKLWDDYVRAYERAIEATASDWAPWYIVPADSKSTRNLVVSSILVDALESLDLRYPEPAVDLSHIVVE